MKTTIYTILFLSISCQVFSQSCEQKLEDAKRAWFNAQFREVENLLSGCLNGELAKDDRFDAYKLMVDSKLLLNEEAEADIYMEKLLSLDPNYQPREVDLAEFKQLYNSYDLRNKYSFGISAGVLIPDYVIIHQHSFSGQAIQPSDYEEITGYSIGLNGSYELLKSLYGDVSILFQKRGFKQEEVIMNFRTITSTQHDYLLSVPIQLKYLIRMKKVGFLIGGGYAFDYLIRTEADIDHWPLNTGILFAANGVVYSAEAYDLTYQQTRFSNNWIVSGAAQYQFSQFLVQLEFSYMRGLTNQVNSAARYDNQEFLDTYAYVPDDYKVNSYTISLKLLKYFSKPYKARL